MSPKTLFLAAAAFAASAAAIPASAAPTATDPAQQARPVPLRAEIMFNLIDQPGIGSYLAPASPLDFSKVPRLPAVPAPRLGQHTDEILQDVLGLSAAEVGSLHDAGIVAGPTN